MSFKTGFTAVILCVVLLLYFNFENLNNKKCLKDSKILNELKDVLPEKKMFRESKINYPKTPIPDEDAVFAQITSEIHVKCIRSRSTSDQCLLETKA